MLKGEIDRNNKYEIKKIGTLVDIAIAESASHMILNIRGNGGTLTIHESSAALGMIFH
jgi:hypothetical protein